MLVIVALLQATVVNRESMESNLLQFSTLLFSNLEELKHFAILKKRRLKGGFGAFNGQDKMDLFSEVNTTQGALGMQRRETKKS